MCGAAPGGISYPGAGVPPSANILGYYYRCYSAAGHCGPKNNIQDQSLYCGAGCQPGYGDCSTDRTPPPLPTAAPTLSRNGETCEPIFDAKCADGLCCSGSNYCGMWLENLGTWNSTDAMCRYWARLLWSSKLVPAAMGRMLLRLLKLNNRIGRPGRLCNFMQGRSPSTLSWIFIRRLLHYPHLVDQYYFPNWNASWH